jgi:hypothetical protein
LPIAALASLMLAVASAGAAGDAGLRVQEMYMRSSANAPPASERQRFDFLVFYANGVAYRGDASLFSAGPAALQPDNESVRRDHLGTYKAVGEDLRIRWPANKTEVMRRRGERLSGAAGTRWLRLPKVDGLQLQGTYVIAAGSAEPVWINFGADGTFWDQGVIRHAANLQRLEGGVPAPQGGGGTYILDDYTLTLSYAGGPAARMFFCILPGEKNLARPKQLVVSTYLFELKQ